MISVIVPVYKVESYLDDCVKSILSQSFTDFELILVDDGSPDRCPAMCDDWAEKDGRIRVIHKENGGLSSARNAGLDVMRGEYLTFIDSDDYVKSDYLEKLYNALIEHRADVSVCGLILEKGKDEYESKTPAVVSGRSILLDPNFTADTRISVSAVWAKLYKRHLFENIRFPLGKLHEDEFVTYRVLYPCETVTVIYDKLYFYRYNPLSITHTRFKIARYDSIRAFEEAASFYESKGDKELYELTKAKKQMLIALYRFYAKQAGIAKQVPKEYRMSFFKAWRTLENYFSNDSFEFEMSFFHPRLVRLRAYMRRLLRPFARSAK